MAQVVRNLVENAEVLALAVNLIVFASLCFVNPSPGRLLYWGGAVILTLGVVLMEG